ncbi:MAG: hypothetical protein E6G56_03145 [Actinobacteria bacterium]|nr:MAG: hypothetical protein E6G56_03145 [Actinomycetota bacterium]
MDDRSPQEPPREVLSSLPHSRPQRRSARREGPGAPAKAAGKATKRPRPARATKPDADARAKAGAKGVAAASGRGAVDQRDLLIKGPRVGPRAPASAAARPRPAVGRDQPPTASAPATRRPADGEDAAARPGSVEPPSGSEILGAAVQSAGELAQLGLKAGTQLLRSAAARIPKP